MMKFGGSLAQNIDFEVANFRLLVKTGRKTSIFELQLVKIEGSLGSLAQNACFEAPTCLVWSLWLGSICGGSCKTFRFQCAKVSNILHSTLDTPHFTLHTPHSTLNTLHSTLYTPHFTLHILHSTLYSPHFALPHFALRISHSTLDTPQITLPKLHSTLSTLYAPPSTLHTGHSTLHTQLYTPHSALHTPDSTL